VAGRDSSNGKVLYDICRSENPRTHFIEHQDELQSSWFEGVQKVGISGATSTPHWLMEQVRGKILETGHGESQTSPSSLVNTTNQ
jgi:4-hydroxy-3-methylbut-2-enyl diphosphate reductase